MESVISTDETWKLPPLILHPFSDSAGPNKLLESSRASLMLQGLLPSGEFTARELEQKLLDGRFVELRMLYYLGRDLIRWIEQCSEIVDVQLTGSTGVVQGIIEEERAVEDEVSSA